MEQNQFSNQGFSPSTPTGIVSVKKGFPLWAKVVIPVVVLFVLGIGVALAARIWDPLWSPFRPSPEKVIEKMFVEMEKVTSLSSDFNIVANLPNNEGFSVQLKDSSDVSNVQSPKSKGSLKAAMETQGIQISLEGEYIALDKSLFVKLNKVPAIPFLPIDLNSLKGKWIKIGADSANSVSNPNLTNLFKQRKDLFVVKEELKDEKINKINCYHYILEIKGDKIGSLLKELTGDISNPLGGETSQLTDEQIKEVTDKIGEIEIEYWISKENNLPIKIKVNKDFSVEGKTISANLEANFSDYGKKFEVKAPDSFVGIEEIMGGLLPTKIPTKIPTKK
jgi:hypothetical protein